MTQAGGVAQDNGSSHMRSPCLDTEVLISEGALPPQLPSPCPAACAPAFCAGDHKLGPVHLHAVLGSGPACGAVAPEVQRGLQARLLHQAAPRREVRPPKGGEARGQGSPLKTKCQGVGDWVGRSGSEGEATVVKKLHSPIGTPRQRFQSPLCPAHTANLGCYQPG